mmetsp:Transcript_18665/g.43881  ORF Transcript_18665/g.43881 Transcript_18665/m.43881 type:complete len:210 (+) Transcript_18665:647-1276(+)
MLVLPRSRQDLPRLLVPFRAAHVSCLWALLATGGSPASSNRMQSTILFQVAVLSETMTTFVPSSGPDLLSWMLWRVMISLLSHRVTPFLAVLLRQWTLRRLPWAVTSILAAPLCLHRSRNDTLLMAIPVLLWQSRSRCPLRRGQVTPSLTLAGARLSRRAMWLQTVPLWQTMRLPRSTTLFLTASLWQRMMHSTQRALTLRRTAPRTPR